MSFVASLRIPAVALLALAPALLLAARSGTADPQLSITTDRLSYRLSRVGEYYHAKIVVTLANSSRDTVYLASRCGFRTTPLSEFVSIQSGELFVPTRWGCAATSFERMRQPRQFAMAIAPDESRRDTVGFGAQPFLRRGETTAREGIARYQLRYTPYVRRGFFRNRWETDPKVWLSSDPFELVTPRFSR